MFNKKILILGGSRYYSRCIEGLKKNNYTVIVADKDKDADGFNYSNFSEVCDIVDKKSVLKVALKYEIDAVVPVNDYGVPTAAYVAEKMGLKGISQEAAELSTNKESMRTRWLDKGLPSPKFIIANDVLTLRDAITEIGFPCIIKPAHGIGGASRGIIVVREPNEIDKSIEFSHRFYTDKSTIVEEFVKAESEHSIEALVVGGRIHIIAVSDKVKSDLPYRVDKAVIYPSALTADNLNVLQKIVADSVLALGITDGVAHVEVGLTDKGFILFELGARCGGGGTANPIVKSVYGFDLFYEYVQLLLGESIGEIQSKAKMGCCYYFLTPDKGVVNNITGFEKIKSLPNVLDAELNLKTGSIINPLTVGTERSGFIIITAKTGLDAYMHADILEKSIRYTYQ